MTASCGLVENHGQLCCVAQMNLLGLLDSPEFLEQIIFSYEYNLAGPTCKLMRECVDIRSVRQTLRFHQRFSTFSSPQRYN